MTSDLHVSMFGTIGTFHGSGFGSWKILKLKFNKADCTNPGPIKSSIGSYDKSDRARNVVVSGICKGLSKGIIEITFDVSNSGSTASIPKINYGSIPRVIIEEYEPNAGSSVISSLGKANFKQLTFSNVKQLNLNNVVISMSYTKASSTSGLRIRFTSVGSRVKCGSYPHCFRYVIQVDNQDCKIDTATEIYEASEFFNFPIQVDGVCDRMLSAGSKTVSVKLMSCPNIAPSCTTKTGSDKAISSLDVEEVNSSLIQMTMG
ncbi:uncharacterized protein LOC141901269 [Tubulanus polymorphus]|uniref:uncharacterized protein LOC141901269 n=1 Tax=Tubulanus polymorphus TaxID=672921 RepID=UPI003DA3E562